VKWDGLDLWSRFPSVSVGDVLGQGLLCCEAPLTRCAIDVGGINMLLESLLIAKRPGAETTLRVKSRIQMLLERLRTAKLLVALLTRYSVRRRSNG
jgi:hypothetical protein